MQSSQNKQTNGVEIFSINVSTNSEHDQRRRSSVIQEIAFRISRVLDSGGTDGERSGWKYEGEELYGLYGFYTPLADPHGLQDNKDTEEVNAGESGCRFERKWPVLFASFFLLFFSIGFTFNMSVLYTEFLDEFQKTKAETSLVQSVTTGLFFCSGLVTGILVTKFGERKCIVVGTLLSSVGLAVSFYATGIPYLTGTIGVACGLGYSLTYVSGYGIIPQYFEGRQKFLGLGFASIGSGIGGLFFPVYLENLLKILSWRSTLLVTAAFNMIMIIFAIICKPKRKQEGTGNETEVPTGNGDNDSQPEPYSETHICQRLRTILKNAPFIFFTISIMLSIACFNSVLIFFIDFYELKGISRPTGVWVYFGMGLTSSVFRMLPGCLAQIERIPKLAIPATNTLIGCIVFAIFPHAQALPELIVLSCIFGSALGGVTSILSITTFHLIGQDNYSTALGMIMTMCGISNIIAGPISGLMRDVSGTYDIAFYTGSGSLFCASAILFITMFCTLNSTREVDNHDMEMNIQKMSRRRSSLLSWKRGLDLAKL